jgi:phosphoglycolate phosphatase
MLLQALQATGAKSKNAVFIGDTAFDMEMALAAKVRPIGVGWGYHRAERLLGAGATRVALDVEELRDCIQNMLDE